MYLLKEKYSIVLLAVSLMTFLINGGVDVSSPITVSLRTDNWVEEADDNDVREEVVNEKFDGEVILCRLCLASGTCGGCSLGGGWGCLGAERERRASLYRAMLGTC